MKNKLFSSLFLLILIPIMCVTSAGCSETSIEESSSINLDEEIQKDSYKIGVEEGKAYSGNLDVSVTSGTENDILSLTVDGKYSEKFRDESDNIKASLYYELDPEHPCSTESVEHCQNSIYLNGTYVDVLHNDSSLSVDFNSSKFKEGENIITLTIGYVYMYKAFSKNAIRYKLGWGDDFRIRNVGIKLSDGTMIKPTGMIGYYCDENVKKYVTVDMINDYGINPEEYYWLGDGWLGSGTNAEEYLAHINHFAEEYIRPFSIDYYFNYSKPKTTVNYTLDSTKYSDGKHTLTAFSNDEVVIQKHIYTDNNAPTIEVNLNDGARVNKNFKFSHFVEDTVTGVNSKTIKIDGKVVESTSFKNLAVGPHSITITTDDLAGNSRSLPISFFIVDEASTISLSKDESGKITSAAGYNTNYNYSEYSYKNLAIDSKNPAKVQSNEGNAYQYFDISVTDSSKDVLLNYNGNTTENESILFEVLDPTTSKYKSIWVGHNGENKILVHPENFINGTKISLRISQRKVDTGCNKMAWASDIQYLAKNESNYQDIKEYYHTLCKYLADEYKENRLCYVANTGDIVDDSPDYGQTAVKEWEHASSAWQSIDDAGLPYGTCAGNHDVGQNASNLSYDYYSQYFGSSRTGLSDYYGESLNDNACHYDLVTIGKFDFIFLYIGFGVEVTDETVTWANNILKKFPHRNAVLLTHAYLDDTGEYDEDLYGEEMFNKIVVPNENVKFVMCGHTDGSRCTRRKIGDSRVVYELLSCYQFVETLTDGQAISSTNHVTNGYKCNGEGWIKDITFKDDGHLVFHTFSPVLNNHHFTSSSVDFELNDYTLKVDLMEKNSTLETSEIKAVQVDQLLSSATEQEASYTPTKADSLVYVTDAQGAFSFIF